MLVWLASYPRSGNTLLRMIVRQLQGGGTYSIYDDRLDIGADAELSEVVGHLEHGKTPAEFIQWAREQPGLVFAKTHEPRPDGLKDPAIYIVRDGRAATYSYWKYHRDILGQDTALMDVIRGNVFGGDWSGHVAGWLGRENSGPTLLVRFEELVSDPAREWSRISKFLGLAGSADEPRIDFDRLHQQFPQFFRSGSNARNISGFGPEELAEFDRVQGATMRALGYADGAGDRESLDQAMVRAAIGSLKAQSSSSRLQAAQLELSVARAIAEYQTDIAERIVALRAAFARAHSEASAKATSEAGENRIALETARAALADLASVEDFVQTRLAASRSRLETAAEALASINRAASI